MNRERVMFLERNQGAPLSVSANQSLHYSDSLTENKEQNNLNEQNVINKVNTKGNNEQNNKTTKLFDKPKTQRKKRNVQILALDSADENELINPKTLFPHRPPPKYNEIHSYEVLVTVDESDFEKDDISGSRTTKSSTIVEENIDSEEESIDSNQRDGFDLERKVKKMRNRIIETKEKLIENEKQKQKQLKENKEEKQNIIKEKQNIIKEKENKQKHNKNENKI